MKFLNTSHSRFFLIYKKNDSIQESSFKLNGFTNVKKDRSWALYADNCPDIPINIGMRHDNGDGIFLRIYKDKESIYFETDKMSGVPVFWLKTESIFIAASDLDLVITVSRKMGIKLKIDMSAASEFLTTGYVFTYPKTLLEKVFLLSPESRLGLNVSNGEISTKRIVEPSQYSEQRLKKEKAPGIFRKVLEEGFERHKGKKIALLLSGGGSCRILASCGIAAGLDISFFTFGQSTVNDSDFSIANKVAYNLGKKTKCFSTSGDNFLANWKNRAAYSNWTNDSVWWAGRIPNEFFENVKGYDLLIRGDGDGCYGWGGNLCSVDDILRRFEITPEAIVLKYKNFFVDSEKALAPAIKSRALLENKYKGLNTDCLELKNILYREIRECHGASPGAWYFSRIIPVEAPFLWEDCLNVAFSVPRKKLIHRWLIFAALELDNKIKGIPFSSSGSWSNRLEFYYSGVWEELIWYCEKWSPFKINSQQLRDAYLCPPEIPKVPTLTSQVIALARKKALSIKAFRKAAFKYFTHIAHSSMSERLVIRLALIGNLCEKLNESEK